ncbi:MAG: ketopantoate reductase family protein, partial [Halobacterium sp.]
MRFVVLGAGSLGSLFAGRLAAAQTDDPGLDVTLLGRESDHVARVRERGLRVTRPDGRDETVDLDEATDYGVASNADVLVLLVKSYDTG